MPCLPRLPTPWILLISGPWVYLTVGLLTPCSAHFPTDATLIGLPSCITRLWTRLSNSLDNRLPNSPGHPPGNKRDYNTKTGWHTLPLERDFVLPMGWNLPLGRAAPSSAHPIQPIFSAPALLSPQLPSAASSPPGSLLRIFQGSAEISLSERWLPWPPPLHLVQLLSCVRLCDPMGCSTPSLSIPELAQTPVHRVGDAIQQSHPLLSPSPPTFNLSQHQGLFKWVSSSYL